jgi:hypothetical protein
LCHIWQVGKMGKGIFLVRADVDGFVVANLYRRVRISSSRISKDSELGSQGQFINDL